MSPATGGSLSHTEGYRQLTSSAALVDLARRSRGRFHGPKAAEVLNGLVTNEVQSLESGQGVYAVALTPKGKILADLRVLRRTDDVLVDVSETAAPGWWAMVRKYVNPRLSRYEDVSESLGCLGLFGPRAAATLGAVMRTTAINALGMLAHTTVRLEDADVVVARIPDAGVEGYGLYAGASDLEALRTALVAAGASPVDASVMDIARVEAGRPAWGIDMDDSTLAQEARLDELEAISYTKGCYTGQETVARVHFRGHVNRFLRGLQFPEGRLPARGATLLRDDDTVVGDVRSAVVSPRYGAIALGMVRREIEAGATLRAVLEPDGFAAAIVTELPFTPEPTPA